MENKELYLHNISSLLSKVVHTHRFFKGVSLSHEKLYEYQLMIAIEADHKIENISKAFCNFIIPELMDAIFFGYGDKDMPKGMIRYFNIATAPYIAYEYDRMINILANKSNDLRLSFFGINDVPPSFTINGELFGVPLYRLKTGIIKGRYLFLCDTSDFIYSYRIGNIRFKEHNDINYLMIPSYFGWEYIGDNVKKILVMMKLHEDISHA